MKLIMTSDLPVTGMSWGYVFGEVLELAEEVVAGRLDGVISEACDVYSCAMCAIETTIGKSVPIVRNRSTDGWLKRQEIWREYLRRMGLKYDQKYLVNGGNYKKACKRRLVVALAVKDQLGKEI